MITARIEQDLLNHGIKLYSRVVTDKKGNKTKEYKLATIGGDVFDFYRRGFNNAVWVSGREIVDFHKYYCCKYGVKKSKKYYKEKANRTERATIKRELHEGKEPLRDKREFFDPWDFS